MNIFASYGFQPTIRGKLKIVEWTLVYRYCMLLSNVWQVV